MGRGLLEGEGARLRAVTKRLGRTVKSVEGGGHWRLEKRGGGWGCGRAFG